MSEVSSLARMIIFLMDDGTEFTMEYKGKNIDFAKMKMAHRDTKGVKVRV